MFTTASPRVYRFIVQTFDTTGVLIEHADSRSWLDPYPRWWGQPVQFSWGRLDHGTILLAASLIWDVFNSHEVVNRTARIFAANYLAYAGVEDAAWITLDQVRDAVTDELANQEMDHPSRHKCQGCGE